MSKLIMYHVSRFLLNCYLFEWERNSHIVTRGTYVTMWLGALLPKHQYMTSREWVPASFFCICAERERCLRKQKTQLNQQRRLLKAHSTQQTQHGVNTDTEQVQYCNHPLGGGAPRSHTRHRKRFSQLPWGKRPNAVQPPDAWHEGCCLVSFHLLPEDNKPSKGGKLLPNWRFLLEFFQTLFPFSGTGRKISTHLTDG